MKSTSITLYNKGRKYASKTGYERLYGFRDSDHQRYHTVRMNGHKFQHYLAGFSIKLLSLLPKDPSITILPCKVFGENIHPLEQFHAAKKLSNYNYLKSCC